eukprot:2801830-Alexandrium_andersonii.AAC.1
MLAWQHGIEAADKSFHPQGAGELWRTCASPLLPLARPLTPAHAAVSTSASCASWCPLKDNVISIASQPGESLGGELESKLTVVDGTS